MKLIKILLRTVAAISFILMLGSLETNIILSAVMLAVFAICTYFAGDCYSIFYSEEGGQETMPRLKCELTFSRLSTISNIAKSTINVISGKENSLSR